jgi:hypothetical protein
MSTLIIILAALALYHFVYEAIVAPSIRLHLRNKLFVLRDEIRGLKASGNLEVEDGQAFWYVHDGINYFLDRLPSLTLASRSAVEAAYRNNQELRQLVAERKALLERCANPQIKDIFERTALVVEEAFIVNAGGWFVYLVPLAVLLFTIGRLNRLASSLVLTPTKDTQRLLPQGEHFPGAIA